MSGATDAYHYTYDDAGRLTEVHRNGTLVSQYEYDGNSNGNSNRTVFRQPASGTEVSATYDDQDRLLTYGPNSYSYTDNGELLSRTGPTSILCQNNMRQVCEFRVVEEFAPKLFADDEGKRLGDTVRKVELATDDPRYHRIGELQRETITATGRSFFHGWDIRYSERSMMNQRVVHSAVPELSKLGRCFSI